MSAVTATAVAADLSRGFNDAAAVDPDARPAIEGDVVRTVCGHRVHNFEHGGEHRDFLSTSTALTIMRWGDVSHVAPAALEYGRLRGSYVDLACRRYEEGYQVELEPRLRGYFEAWLRFLADEKPVMLAREELVVNGRCATFGYLDRRVLLHDEPTIIDLKTSAHIGQAYRLQLASYAVANERRLVVQAQKDGRYQLHWFTDAADFSRFAMLADEAHMWIAEEEARTR